MTLATPALEHVLDLLVEVGTPDEIGEGGTGLRRVVPIVGGSVSGTLGTGRIVPGGADFQLIRPDGFTDLQARYVIELDRGARIYVENTAIRSGPPEALERIRRGQPVDPALIYFRGVPRFETADPDLSWITRCLCIATGARRPDRVELSVFQVK